MPTMEIVALGCKAVPELPAYSCFHWEAETKLESHRGLFQSVFDETEGIIVHLGNKNQEEEGVAFADALVAWRQDGYIIIPEIDSSLGDDQWQGEDQDNNLRFLPAVIPELRHLMSLLLDCSPVHQMYFSTDYQFGPGEAIQKNGYTFSSFFEEHDQSALRFNTLYHIAKE